MANITVRDIDDADYENLRRIAKANNRSAAAQVRDMIAELRDKRPSADQAVADLMEFRRRYAIKPRAGEDAVSMVRAIRGE
jgi:plasmid stability protein